MNVDMLKQQGPWVLALSHVALGLDCPGFDQILCSSAFLQDPSILRKYFKEYAECPEYVVQESSQT